jgi:CBS domain-containing protein
MQVRDVMTTDVISVAPSATVAEIAKLFLDRRISGAPVVGDDGALRGVVSEGDLVRRAEIGTETRRSWWLSLFTSAEEKQAHYVKEHGRTAEQVMTRRVVTTGEDATLAEVAGLLERHGVKRLPVVRDGKVVGIVSRANVLQGLASAPPSRTAARKGDRELREAVMKVIAEESGSGGEMINVVVHEGVVQLWGTAANDMAERAAVVAAESVPGVQRVESRLGRVPAWAYGY